MRIRPTIIGALASAGVLVVGWQTGAAGLPTNTQAQTSSAPANSSGTSGTDTSASGVTSSPPASAPGTTTTIDGVYTGDSVSTRFGDVQVEVAITGGQIVDVTALHLTDNERKSVQISNRAAPLLRAEVLAAQSANVATIGGATYTSDAYLSSLQSALDQAGL